MATYRVTYEHESGVILQMMFGDSYKTWKQQRREYEGMTQFKGWKRIKVERSYSPWIGFGGLKWCDWRDFQDALDTEPGSLRKAKDFIFKRIANRN